MSDTALLIIAAAIAGLVAIAFVMIWMRNAAAENRRRTERKTAFERRSRSADAYQVDYDKALAKLHKKWVVIDIIHDLANFPLGPAGLPDEISYEEAFDIVSRIRAAQHSDIAVVLHTPGGLVAPTEMIALALKQHKGKKEAFVPYAAMSGGTIIALATQVVHMTETAALGPTDIQVAGFPASAYDYVREKKSFDQISDGLLMLAHVKDKMTKGEAARLQKTVDPAHGPTIAASLGDGARPHGEMIMRDEAKDLGVIVSDEVPREVFDLVDARLRILAMKRAKLFDAE